MAIRLCTRTCTSCSRLTGDCQLGEDMQHGQDCVSEQGWPGAGLSGPTGWPPPRNQALHAHVNSKLAGL